jgi:general secretion pathway protein N
MKQAPVLVALVLLGILTFQWIGWPPPAPSRESTNVPGTTEPVAPPTQPDLLARLDTGDTKDHYVSIIERPLFRPDRKPEPPSDEQSGPEVPQESTELSAFDLNAVLITPDVVSAWIQDPAQPKLRRLRIGDDLQGWSVTGILEDRVLLERQGQQDALILRDYSKASPATAPPPARKVLPRPPPRAPVRAEPPKP